MFFDFMILSFVVLFARKMFWLQFLPSFRFIRMFYVTTELRGRDSGVAMTFNLNMGTIVSTS